MAGAQAAPLMPAQGLRGAFGRGDPHLAQFLLKAGAAPALCRAALGSPMAGQLLDPGVPTFATAF